MALTPVPREEQKSHPTGKKGAAACVLGGFLTRTPKECLTSRGHRELHRERGDTDGADGVALVLPVVVQGHPSHPQGARGQDTVPPVTGQGPPWEGEQLVNSLSWSSSHRDF